MVTTGNYNQRKPCVRTTMGKGVVDAVQYPMNSTVRLVPPRQRMTMRLVWLDVNEATGIYEVEAAAS